MDRQIPITITRQLTLAEAVLQRHLGDTLCAIHLFGSALEGGLQAHSDIDLLVTVHTPPSPQLRQGLQRALLAVSAPPAADSALRALEVTVVNLADIVPWRYPAKRELQFGEWLRQDILHQRFELPMQDHDLAILLSKVRQCSVPLSGPVAQELFDPVPQRDFYQALSDTVTQWVTPEDWQGDERNIVLALARIWYSAATGQIAPKQQAAAWLLERIDARYAPVLRTAQQAYLGLGPDTLAAQVGATAEFINFAKRHICRLLPPVTQAKRTDAED